MTQKKHFLITSLFLSSIYTFAQVGIGTDSPDSTSLLDITSSNQGITIPQTALTSLTVKAPVTDAVDGLIIYNTTEDSTIPLFKGLYYWSDGNSNWQNLIVTDNIADAFKDFGLEQPYVIINESTSQTFTSTETQLTFSSTSVDLNKDNVFTPGTDSYFTVPETGLYNIFCGMDVASSSTKGTDVATTSLKFYPSGSTTVDTSQTVTSTKSRGNILTYLTPSAVFSGSLSQGDIVRCTGTSTYSGGGTTGTKYFYVKKY